MKIKKYITLILISLLFYSCDNEEKDYFDESAANRITAAVAEYDRILKSSPNGWKMEFYAGSEDQKLGGFNFLCLFKENNEVDISADSLVFEVAYGSAEGDELFKKVSSSFAVIAEQGPVLTFNTYNELFHPLSEPLGSIITYQGDYEFIIMDATNDRMELKGKKWGKRIILTRLDETNDWKNILKSINEVIVHSLPFTEFKVTSAGKVSGSVSLDETIYDFTSTDGKPIVSENAIYTATGIKFYKPLEIDGKKVQSFTWNKISQSYTSVEENGSVVLVGQEKPDYFLYEDLLGDYEFQYTGTAIGAAIVKKNASLLQLKNNQSFTLKGAFGSNVVVNYDRRKGSFYIRGQQVANFGALKLYLTSLAWGAGGYLTPSETVGLNCVWDGTSSPKVFNFVDNGAWNIKADGFILWLYDAAGTSAGEFPLGTTRFINMKLTEK